jgi:hypothetical protein
VDVKRGLGPRASGLGLLVVVACSGSKTKVAAVDDARGLRHGDAAVAAPKDADVPVDPTKLGDVQIRVEWKDVPTEARAEPGRTSCGTPRLPSVTPTTTWGIPDVFVQLDATGKPAPRALRIAFADCALSPRVGVASTLSVASETETPAKVALIKVGALPFGGDVKDTTVHHVYLPTAGHEVDLGAEPNAIYRLGAGPEMAWFVASDNPFIAVTEANGNVTLRDVPAGTHTVTAWLPPRAEQPGRIGHGKITVTQGALAEITLELTKP